MYFRIRRRVFHLLTPEKGGRLGYYVDAAIIALICLNVLMVILETVDGLRARYGQLFYWFEVFSVTVFTAEYLGRLWTSVENGVGPTVGRVRFATKPMLLVDLVAIAPFYMAGLGFTADLRYVRVLRLVRLFRLFKLARYSSALRLFAKVFRDQRENLAVAVFINFLLWVFVSSLMYTVEHPVQPEAFSSIPAAMWWGVVTLTTVGYGGVVPVTPLGRVLGTMVAFLGVGLFALPASILAAGFLRQSQEAESRRCPHCGERLDDGPHPDGGDAP